MNSVRPFAPGLLAVRIADIFCRKHPLADNAQRIDCSGTLIITADEGLDDDAVIADVKERMFTDLRPLTREERWWETAVHPQKRMKRS